MLVKDLKFYNLNYRKAIVKNNHTKVDADILNKII